jgi:hypothetical protein
MVYCSRCGTQNLDTNTVCSNCGAPLYTVGQRYPGSDREHYRRMENECFGLPNGGMIVGIIIGVIIILVGLGLFVQAAYGISINFWQYIWPFIIIIFGILILLGGIYRQRRHRERPSNPP